MTRPLLDYRQHRGNQPAHVGRCEEGTWPGLFLRHDHQPPELHRGVGQGLGSGGAAAGLGFVQAIEGEQTFGEAGFEGDEAFGGGGHGGGSGLDSAPCRPSCHPAVNSARLGAALPIA